VHLGLLAPCGRLGRVALVAHQAWLAVRGEAIVGQVGTDRHVVAAGVVRLASVLRIPKKAKKQTKGQQKHTKERERERENKRKKTQTKEHKEFRLRSKCNINNYNN